MTRLDDLQAKLTASVDSEGKSKKGYKTRVVALIAEIARLSPPDTAAPEGGDLTAGGELP